MATDLGLLRLVAQRLAGPGLHTVAETVAWMTAMQAQDFPGACTSVALRTQGADVAAVHAALDAGEVVRSWPMRGTLHLVPAVDLGWMLDLGPPRIATTVARRHGELGVDDAAIDHARTVATEALRGRRALLRRELMARWEDEGLSTDGQRGYHLLAHLATTGTLVLGPMRDGEQAFVLLDEWVPHPRRLDRDEALGEWVLRYFHSHGPATVKDFCRWTRLRVADAKIGLAVARPELVSLEVDGVEHLMDPATPDLLAQARREASGVLLLPGFDEYLLGYADRSAVLPTEHADRICPGGNGIFQPTVVARGQVVGTWRRTGRERVVEASPFTTFTTRTDAAIRRRAAALDAIGSTPASTGASRRAAR